MDDKFCIHTEPENFHGSSKKKEILMRKVWRISQHDQCKNINDLELFINEWSEESLTVH